jgi:hypothetical protein
LVGLFWFVLLVCLFVFLRDSSKPVNTEDCTNNNVASLFFFFCWICCVLI